jgi:hypothetical protein
MRCGPDGETMNDEFLHQLRVQPSASFAAKLKVKLDTQSTIAAAKRRAVKWYALCTFLLGTTAVAVMVPSVRTAVVSWLHGRSDVTVVDASAPPATVVSSSTGEVRHAAIVEPASFSADARPASSVGGEQISVAPIESGTADLRGQQAQQQGAGPTLLPDSRRVVHLAVSSTAKGAADKMVAAFESAYGYEVRQRTDAQPACSRWPLPDVFVTFGRMNAYEETSCRKVGVSFITTPIAYDAYVAIVNRENTWAQSLTLDDLRALAQPRTFPNPIATWDQIRAEWPSLPINVVGLRSTMGNVGGTFVSVRSASPLPFVIDTDDEGIVKMIDASYGGLGFMSFATYIKQLEKASGALPVKVLAVVSDSNEAVLPSADTVQSGRYDTLSRPVLLHVNSRSLQRIEVASFGTHMVEAMPNQLGDLGYTGIDKLTMDTAARKFRALSSRSR